jgi:hypothetical protein
MTLSISIAVAWACFPVVWSDMKIAGSVEAAFAGTGWEAESGVCRAGEARCPASPDALEAAAVPSEVADGGVVGAATAGDINKDRRPGLTVEGLADGKLEGA